MAISDERLSYKEDSIEKALFLKIKYLIYGGTKLTISFSLLTLFMMY